MKPKTIIKLSRTRSLWETPEFFTGVPTGQQLAALGMYTGSKLGGSQSSGGPSVAWLPKGLAHMEAPTNKPYAAGETTMGGTRAKVKGKRLEQKGLQRVGGEIEGPAVAKKTKGKGGTARVGGTLKSPKPIIFSHTKPQKSPEQVLNEWNVAQGKPAPFQLSRPSGPAEPRSKQAMQAAAGRMAPKAPIPINVRAKAVPRRYGVKQITRREVPPIVKEKLNKPGPIMVTKRAGLKFLEPLKERMLSAAIRRSAKPIIQKARAVPKSATPNLPARTDDVILHDLGKNLITDKMVALMKQFAKAYGQKIPKG